MEEILLHKQHRPSLQLDGKFLQRKWHCSATCGGG